MKPKPFINFPELDGCHCQTSSFAKIFHFNNCLLSEDMLLGLGAGMGFMYWHQKGTIPFLGGRGNYKNFCQDLEKRTGVKFTEFHSSSEKKAEKILIEHMEKKIPLAVDGDMAYLPWFGFPEGYHFGGHTFVICGWDGKDTFLASDMDPKAIKLKKAFYHPITREQLALARNSKFKPFPPANHCYIFDFSEFRKPGKTEIINAIHQAAESMLHPPISNMGIRGIRKSGKMIKKWPEMMDEKMLSEALFNIYIFIEVGGTGGGCFRYMYSRFLKEAAEITGNSKLETASEMINRSGEKFSQFAVPFKDCASGKIDINCINRAPEIMDKIADIEEEAFGLLEGI